MMKAPHHNLIFAMLCCVLMISNGISTGIGMQFENLSEKDLFKYAESYYTKGDWESCYKAFKLAFSKRNGKEHKRYSPLFAEVRGRLANLEAVRGQQELSQDALNAAEKRLQSAKAYLIPEDIITKTVSGLQESIEARKSELKRQFDDAKAAANANDYERALKMLSALLKFEPYLRGVKTEIQNTEVSFQNFLIQAGLKACANRSWQPAISYFQRVLLRDANNAQAKAGIERVDHGERADALAETAKLQAVEKNFPQALRSIDSALQLDKEAEAITQLKTQITSQWIQSLADSIPIQLADDSDFSRSRNAILSLETLQQLKPDHPLVAANLTTASRAFAANSLGYVDQLSNSFKDGSRSATQYALLIGAKSRTTGDTVSHQQIMDVVTLFNRKRSSQIIMDIPNAASAPSQFENAIRARAITSIDKLELPDLRVRRKEEYASDAQHDPMFWDRTAAGRCSVMFLTILIEKHYSERIASDTAKDSKYLAGTESHQNLDFIRKKKETDQKIQDIKTKKIKMRDSDREFAIEQLRDELKSIPETVTESLFKEYKYREVVYTQTTELILVATLTDALSAVSLSRITIPYSSSVKGTEITGVNEKDATGRQNQNLIMTSKEEALGQAQRFVLDELGNKLPEMLALFTNRFLQEGTHRKEENKLEDAVENFLCHWAFFRARLSPADIQLIQGPVMALTGFDIIKNKQEFLKLINPITASR
jgi:hypothetical protein